MPIPVLYVHHSGIFGGASRSLLELIRGFPEDGVRARLVTQRGEVAKMGRDAGLEVIETAGISQLDHSRYGHYRGHRWLLLIREIALLAPTLLGLWRAKRRWPDTAIVHINEVTLLPVFWMTKLLFRCPVVTHVRSVQQTRPAGWRHQLREMMLKKSAAVVAIDETVRASLPDLPNLRVIHNGLAPPGNPPPRKEPPSGPLRIGMVGNLLAMKGVREFVDAAALCKARGLAVKFLFFGGNARTPSAPLAFGLRLAGFTQNVESALRQRAGAGGVDDIVEFYGFQSDLARIYPMMDVLCFPSRLDAPGRPVFEAAFWAVPSIVALKTPKPDTFVDGETGIAVEPSAESIASAIARLCANPGEVIRLGNNARNLALKNFDSRRNARQMLDLYLRLVEEPAAAVQPDRP
ncbi:MAG: glycosyltransferase family 4 protein [Betaproteobacteria bacterium]